MLRSLVWFLLLAGACAASACGRGDGDQPRPAGQAQLPPSDDQFHSFPAGATVDELLPAVDEGLRETPEKGPDLTRFLVLRAGDRHGPEYREGEFHVIVGAGLRYPEGALRVRRRWNASGMITGNNEEPQKYGLSIVVEPGAALPFPDAVTEAVRRFAAALVRRVAIHPDCVLAMQEIPFTEEHPADVHERRLAAAARAMVPVPAPDRTIVVVTGKGRHPVDVEVRDTESGRAVGMMFRRGFDGENRGMLFRYPWPYTRYFVMRNCRMPIDLAYIRNGRIEQILTMQPQWGVPSGAIRPHQSNAAVNDVLEMPEGWFAAHGVKVGDSVEFE